MNTNKPCTYFQNGSCRNGNNCKFLHVNIQQNQESNQPYNSHQGQGNNKQGFNQGNPNMQNKFNQQKFHNTYQNTQNNQPQSQGLKKKICTYFTKPGGCKNGQSCHFLHNYHETLHHIKNEKIHNDVIVGCVAIGNLN